MTSPRTPERRANSQRVRRSRRRVRVTAIGLACLAVSIGQISPGPVHAFTATKADSSPKSVAVKKSVLKKSVLKKSVLKKSVGSKNVVAAKKSVPGQMKPNGRAPKDAVPFLYSASPVGGMTSAANAADALSRLPVVNGLFTLLIIGSDARPGENATRTRGDSVHLLVLNPATQKGTIVGFPRDSYVPIAGHGSAKLTSALAWGGPDLMVSTIRTLTNIPVTNYVVTGFAGFTALVDAIGGVNQLVDPAMNDRFSGAMFAKGWFSMNGPAALAFNRDRHDVANGDFGRSANQGKFLLSTLARLRESTSDSKGLLVWIAALKQQVSTNIPLKDLLVFAQAARGLAPSSFTSVVVPGANAKVKAQAVVKLTPPATALFANVAADGVL